MLAAFEILSSDASCALQGCGIVQYHTREDAADAVLRLDGSDLSGANLPQSSTDTRPVLLLIFSCD